MGQKSRGQGAVVCGVLSFGVWLLRGQDSAIPFRPPNPRILSLEFRACHALPVRLDFFVAHAGAWTTICGMNSWFRKQLPFGPIQESNNPKGLREILP